MRRLAKRTLFGASAGMLAVAASLVFAAPAGAADGSGTLIVAPTIVGAGSAGNTLTFTFTVGAPMTAGEVDVVVPGAWSPPSTTDLTANGYVTASCGTATVSGMTIAVTGITKNSGTCTITYGDKTQGGLGATAPNSATISTFAASERDTSGGTLTALGSSPTVDVAANGAGTMTVVPSEVAPSSSGNTLIFTYTASAEGMNNGEIELSIPSEFTPPNLTSGTAGYVTDTCGVVPSLNPPTIILSGVTLGPNGPCTITYGDKTGGGPGAATSATSGSFQFTTDQSSVPGPMPTPIAAQPDVAVGAISDGLGTLTVLPTSVSPASTGNTLTFTYTASGNGVSNGEITVTVPSGWSAPTTTTGGTGYTTSTCGAVAISSSTIEVTGVNLGSNGTCTIVYGSKASGSAGSTAPSSPVVSTFATEEESTSSGTLSPLATSPEVTVGNATPALVRIAGVDPIGTSIATSEAEFPTAGSAGAVVLARDDFFSDALAGGPLAASVNGPMLITGGAPITGSLDPRVQSEIQRVLPSGGTVYILGGDLALSPNIDATLTSLGYHVVRLAGSDEFQTAVLIAEQMGNPSTVFEATGLSFYDALSAVPAAIKVHAAILLTNGSSQSSATGFYILAHPSDARYAIGGPLAASGADPGATPVFGEDLYSTSAAVASAFFPSATIFGVATSASFPDALGGGVYMATGGRSGPLLIVDPNPPVPSEIVPYLNSLPIGSQGYVFGGPLAIADTVLTALQGDVG